MTPPLALAPNAAGDAGFAALKALIIERTGHFYYADKDAQLWEHLALRMAALGIAGAEIYRERLEDASAGPREWRLLESALTINETFFFRFAEQFAALRSHILPSLIADHAEDRSLRLWSAGCSTGAEPYSLAVLLHDLLGDGISGWSISILGTDIDEAALDAARHARFGEWALRGVAEQERDRLFEHDKKMWRLRLPYRAMVRFERRNLLDLLGPAVPLQLSDYDLILCRNLLIYFHHDVAGPLVTALGGRLGPRGLLMLGHAEAGMAAGSGLAAVEIGGIAAYRCPGIETIPGPSAAPPRARAPRRPAPPRRVRRRGAAAPATLPRSAQGDRIAEVRRLLALGDMDAARALIGDARATADPVLLYLDGLAAVAQRDTVAAERALRGALYLDGGFAMAHYLLGEQLVAAGREAEGRRALANAARAIEGIDPAAPVREGEGLTIGDLRASIRHRLDGAGAVR